MSVAHRPSQSRLAERQHARGIDRETGGLVGRDHPVAHEVLQLLVHQDHAFLLAGLDHVVHVMALALANQGPAGLRAHEDLLGGHPSVAIGATQQQLGADADEDLGEGEADGGLLVGGEDVGHPADGLGCRTRVEGAEDEQSQLRCGKGELDRLQVPHLPDQDHVGIGPQRSAQGVREAAAVLADLALLGAFGGLYSVPLYAMIQERAERQHLSRIIAANNILNALFMVAAAGLAIFLLSSGVSIPQFFLVLALLNALVAIYIYTLLPEFLIRFLAWILINTLYRVRAIGLENIPREGPAVLVCNHVSFVDALLVGGTIRRPVRFVMYYRIFEIPLLKFLFNTAKAIPIASAKEDEALLEEAFGRIDAELEAGNVVCIYPEGAITRDGEIHRFRPGIERIIERRPVPVIPMALGGLWGSWFSRRSNGSLRRLPGRLFQLVTLRIGEPVAPGEVSAQGLELLVRTLRGEVR